MPPDELETPDHHGSRRRSSRKLKTKRAHLSVLTQIIIIFLVVAVAFLILIVFLQWMNQAMAAPHAQAPDDS